MKVDSSGMTTTGMTPRTPLCTFQPEIQRAAKPPTRPVTRPPRKPAPIVEAIEPPTMPGTRPGRSAIAKAMKPDRIGTRNPKAAPPMTNSSPAHLVRLSGSKVWVMLYSPSAVSPYLTISMAPCSPIASCASMNDRAMRMPPAATNGIMYDTPVISHWRTLVTVLASLSTLVVRPPDAVAAAVAAAALPGSARHCAARARACSMRAGASEMPFLTPTSTVGLPAKRPASLTGRSCAKTTASAAAISSAPSGVVPAEPWVSTVMTWPAARAAFSRASAAM